jgi:hypothetical protein
MPLNLGIIRGLAALACGFDEPFILDTRKYDPACLKSRTPRVRHAAHLTKLRCEPAIRRADAHAARHRAAGPLVRHTAQLRHPGRLAGQHPLGVRLPRPAPRRIAADRDLFDMFDFQRAATTLLGADMGD